MSNGFENGQANGNGIPVADDSASGSPVTPNEKTMPIHGRSASVSMPAAVPEAVEKVLYSDIGITTLLNRLKQSIASARDFAAFLKKRSQLEEDQATGLKRLAKAQMDGLRRIEVKSGSYATSLQEVMRVHEKMGDNGMQFALSLHQMHEDLNELSANMERGRKQWKHEGLDAEKRAADAEAAMHKAKSRYDSLAEDYDRARTGDAKGSRRLGLKGPKSAEQYEQDMARKTQAADAEYEERVKQAKTLREGLVERERPKAVKALQELIRECDSALTLQLQKYASFNEKLLLGNGLAISPLTDKDSPGAQRSLRDIVCDIDNDTDFNAHVRSFVGKVPARPSEIKYEQHPTLMPKTQKPIDTQQRAVSSSQAAALPPSLALNTAAVGAASTGSSSLPSSLNNRYANQPPPQPAPYNQPPSTTSYQQPPPPQQQSYQSPTSYTAGVQHPAFNTSQSQTREPYSATSPPYPVQPVERANPNPYAPGQTTGVIAPSIPMPQRQNANTLPALRPVFGVSLDELFNRDQSAIPMVVIQCILAVDTFGLDVEGIYRLSGTASHINTLKQQFDHNAAAIDFRNPAAFLHDVNSVATLLKQFFRDLPDPLFTKIGYSTFIEAARIEDDVQRRDALHQGINDLPDPNYATLRSLVLHLHRVMQNESRNRMGASNLALCFAPSLMGTHTGPQIADASLQARALDTILVNATAIFDDD